MRCHQLCWFLCDESLLCSFSNRNLGQITEIVYEKQKVTLNDGWAMFLCSKNRVDVHCWDLTVPWGCPPAWICSTLFLQTHELGQDGSSLPWVPECVAGWGFCCPTGCPQPPALPSQPGCHVYFPKSHTITPTSEFALTPATMKILWKCWTEYFPILWGKIGGFIFFLTLPALIGSLPPLVSDMKKFLNGCYLSFVYPA